MGNLHYHLQDFDQIFKEMQEEAILEQLENEPEPVVKSKLDPEEQARKIKAALDEIEVKYGRVRKSDVSYPSGDKKKG